MKLDLDTLKDMLKVVVNSLDTCEASARMYEEIDNMFIDESGWVVFDNSSYCLLEED